MTQTALIDRLAFLTTYRHEGETAILTEALSTGIQALYRETLIEAYLLGQVSRATLLQELGPEQLEKIEYQRDALRRDVAWGLEGA